MLQLRIWIATLGILLFASDCAGSLVRRSPLDISSSKLLRITHLLRGEVSSGRTVGLSVAIAFNGAIYYQRSFGYRNRERHLPVTTDTRFAIGSITKQFTAAAILLLARSGKLQLSDAVSRFVPEYKYAAQITIQQLLQQTSGVPTYTGFHAGDFSATANWDDLVLYENRRPLVSYPGRTFQYNNFNYFLLTKIIERASGVSFPQYIRARIFEPLSLQSFEYVTNYGSMESRDRLAVGYNSTNGRFHRAPFWSIGTILGAGGLAATAGDLARWDVAVFEKDVFGHDFTDKLLAVPAIPDDNYALGLVYQDREPGERYVWHNGRLPGFRAMNACFIDERLAVVVLANSDDLGDAGIIPEDVAEEILGIIAPNHAYSLGSDY